MNPKPSLWIQIRIEFIRSHELIRDILEVINLNNPNIKVKQLYEYMLRTNKMLEKILNDLKGDKHNEI